MKKYMLALFILLASCQTTQTNSCFENIWFLTGGPKHKNPIHSACENFKDAYGRCDSDASVIVRWVEPDGEKIICKSSEACVMRTTDDTYIIEIRKRWQSSNYSWYALYHEYAHVLLFEHSVDDHHQWMYKHRMCPRGMCGKQNSVKRKGMGSYDSTNR